MDYEDASADVFMATLNALNAGRKFSTLSLDFLASAHRRRDTTKRFTGAEPTGYGDLIGIDRDDPRRDEWAEDAKREAAERRREAADSYRSGGFGL